ncbi:hypothetical protein [Bradyrhizobium sp. UFLA05-112]
MMVPELTGGAIRVQSLFEHPFVCLVRENHPDFGRKMTLRQYSQARHIGLVGEGHSQRKFETMIKKSGIERNIAFRSQHHFMNIPFIVRDSDLVATVPKVIAVAFENLSGLRALWPHFRFRTFPSSSIGTKKSLATPHRSGCERRRANYSSTRILRGMCESKGATLIGKDRFHIRIHSASDAKEERESIR